MKTDYLELEISRLPCHTQAVERAIKLVTEASVKVSEKEERDGYIKNVLVEKKGREV